MPSNRRIRSYDSDKYDESDNYPEDSEFTEEDLVIIDFTNLQNNLVIQEKKISNIQSWEEFNCLKLCINSNLARIMILSTPFSNDYREPTWMWGLNVILYMPVLNHGSYLGKILNDKSIVNIPSNLDILPPNLMQLVVSFVGNSPILE